MEKEEAKFNPKQFRNIQKILRKKDLLASLTKWKGFIPV